MKTTKYKLTLSIHLFDWYLIPYSEHTKGYGKHAFLCFSITYRNKKYGF